MEAKILEAFGVFGIVLIIKLIQGVSRVKIFFLKEKLGQSKMQCKHKTFGSIFFLYYIVNFRNILFSLICI